MTKTAIPSPARVPAQILAASCLLVLGADWLSPLLILALATGSLAGALSRHLLAVIPHGTRAGPLWCEVPTALLWTLVAHLWQHDHVPTAWLPVLLPLTWIAVPLAVVDVKHRRLPRSLTIPAVVAALPLLACPASASGWSLLLDAVAGAAILHALHALVHRGNPSALGKGDVILAAPLGAVQGALGLAALIPASLLASLITLALHAVTRSGAHRRTGIPHAPGMLAATTAITLVSLAGIP